RPGYKAVALARSPARDMISRKTRENGGISPRRVRMATWKPDPSFYPSPRQAAKAAPESVAYVAAFDPRRKSPDAIAVVDVNPKSSRYSKIINSVKVTNTGDEFHHVACNACSSCLCPTAPHPHVERRFLVVPRTALLAHLCPRHQARSEETKTR